MPLPLAAGPRHSTVLPPWWTAAACGLLILLMDAGAATADHAARTLVLPFRTLGISDTTTSAVVRDLLAGELEKHGVSVVPSSHLATDLPAGDRACDEVVCARSIADSAGADRVIFGSLSRLGDKVIVRVRALDLPDGNISYSDQLSAINEEDLDTVARRIAEGLASGRPNAERATVQSVTLQETETPRRRTSRTGAGFRTGFLFPDGDSYGGADRLASLRLALRYEVNNLFVETTPVIGFQWGEHNFEWTFLDMTVGRLFGSGDWSPFVAGGIGVHSVRVARVVPTTYDAGGGNIYTYDTVREQIETTLAADAGVGLLMLRTYDFTIVAELKYHVVFASFDELGGTGAHGISLSFGTTR